MSRKSYIKLLALGIALGCCLPGNIQNANAKEFDGAKWITVPSDKLPLYPDYLPVFKLDFNVNLSPGEKASLVFGADDPRLMDRNKNIFGLANKPGESFVRFEFSQDSIAVFRVGYHPEDNPDRPLSIIPIGKLNEGENHFQIADNLGHTDIFVNGEKKGYVGLNPIANGGDYIAFPVLGSIAVEGPVSNLSVRNYREPSNIIWKAENQMIPDSIYKLPVRSMPEMRTVIKLDPTKRIAKATANVTAMGIYDLMVSGERVHDDYYLPGSTQYNKTHLYHTFDITDRLKQSCFDVNVQLGEGWWSGPATFSGENWNFFGDRQALLGEIIVDYTDGSSERFVTSPESWECSVDGPLIVGSFFQGEIFDSNKKKRVWEKAVELPFNESVSPVSGGWDNVNLRPSFGDRILPVDTLSAVAFSEPRKGVFVYDMGQNMAGVPYISFSGLKPGQEVTIRHAEVLYPNMERYADNAGMIMTENLRAAMCQDKYIASGDNEEVFSPRHTLHGFRFLEITGLEEPLPLEDVKSIPVSSVHEFRAGFECSDSLVNRLWENIKWSTLSNFISIPTDCPQRNERLGWMGDISVYSPTATKIADVSALLRQYLQSVRDCQSDNGRFPDVAPTGCGFGGFLWGSAGITVPWEYYSQYGDKEILKEHYPAMKRYIDYIFRETIEPSTNVLVQNREWGDLGDWLSPEYYKNDKSLLWECYLIYDLSIMRNVAHILSQDDSGSREYENQSAKSAYDEDVIRYDSLINDRKKFFAATYVDPVTEKTRWSAFEADKIGEIVDTQSSYALPLAMGIYDTPRFRDNFVATIERENRSDDGKISPPYSLMTGFIGTAWISEALSKIGRDDIAYRLLTSTTYPSWLYPVTQGATTVWERLNSYTDNDGFGSNNSMNSFNHYSFGSVGNWLITRVLGIQVSPEGEISVNPTPDPTGRITYAKGWLDTPQGRIESSWHREGSRIIYDTKKP